MRTVTGVAVMQRLARRLHRDGRRIGLVPTMGFLHEGHLSLVRKAARHADTVMVSIFVNPTQFGPHEDLGRYPRDLDRDRKLLKGLGCCDIVFIPAADDLYPGRPSTVVEEHALSAGLCGAARPGHFRGVTTVVAKLFNITGADLAVFGRKDLQQTRVIRRMVRDLNMPVRIVEAPLVRDHDGLALSSRNRYLSAEERSRALVLSRSLRFARQRAAAGGRLSAGVLKRQMKTMICNAGGIKLEYLDILDEETLVPLKTVRGRAAVALAARVGTTRLIDNEIIGKAGGK